jgi:hypothetical protein
MDDPLQLYKKFIDGLVKIREGVLGRWITERGWPDLPENKKINVLLKLLTNEQKQIVADIAREARDGGIHDTLVYLEDEINLNGMRLMQHGMEFPVDPFDTEIYYDWVCRREGDAWPDEK